MTAILLKNYTLFQIDERSKFATQKGLIFGLVFPLPVLHGRASLTVVQMTPSVTSRTIDSARGSISIVR
jgi:hypothetical protein